MPDATTPAVETVPPAPAQAAQPAAKPAKKPSAQTLAIKALQDEVLRLRVLAEGKKEIPAIEVSDADYESLVAKLESEAATDLKSDNPKARPSLRLLVGDASVKLTPAQRANWKPRKAAMEKAHSAKHRQLLPERKAAFARIAKDANALVGTTLRKSKSGELLAASLSARRKAKAGKGKGLKKAKPAQIAARVPAAGNAASPAMVS